MLEIKNVSKKYGHQVVLSDVSLNIAPGETVSLIGESGSGKSTLSRLILALERPSCGCILWNGKNVSELRGKMLYRDIQPVFQDNASCFNPRRKVMDSLCEPMKNMLQLGQAERERKIYSLLDMAGLPAGIVNRYPHELSGGQQKRICIVRAISSGPKLIILDEAVTGLDATVMIKILVLLKDLQKEIGCAYLFITHDLRTALYMSKKIAVMKDGWIVETVENIISLSAFTHPFSKQLVGNKNYKLFIQEEHDEKLYG